MPQTIITVTDKQSPAIGKKQGKIKDSHGRLWNVWGDKIGDYREGVSYEITYEEKEFNEHKFNLITGGNPTNAAQQPLPLKPQGDGWPGPIPQTKPAPQVYQLTAKDEMIFVCGIMNNAMGNANVNPLEMTVAEMISMVSKTRQTWRNTFGKTQYADDMNDEIPDFK